MQTAHRSPAAPRRAPASRTLRILVGAAAAATLATAASASESDDEAFYQRASTCAAALQIDQLALVARARAGATDLRPELVQITRLGFAYVGEAYLKGLRDPRGSDMLKAATAEQKSWPESRHKALVAQCRVEAQKVYDNAGMWQWAVDGKATKRVDRFLATLAPASSAAAAAASSASR